MNDLEDVIHWLENEIENPNLAHDTYNNAQVLYKENMEEAVEVLREHQQDNKAGNRKEYHRTSVSRGKARGNYYPRLSFQKEILEEIGFTYKTPLKVEVDFDDEEVTFYKE